LSFIKVNEVEKIIIKEKMIKHLKSNSNRKEVILFEVTVFFLLSKPLLNLSFKIFLKKSFGVMKINFKSLSRSIAVLADL